MSDIAIGQAGPDFQRPATGDQEIQWSALRGQRVLLYFYPKDNTPGCTTESQEFAAAHDTLKDHNVVMFGVSRDSIKSHEKFKAKLDLPFELISDEDETLCRSLDVIQLKNMYGRQVEGIVRSTFLFDEQGLLLQAWRKVRVKGHVDAVVAAVEAL